MADSRTIQVNLKAVSDFSDVVSNAKQIQTVLNKLKLPDTLKANFDKIFGDIEKHGSKAAQAVANGFKSKGDLGSFEKSVNSINNAWSQMIKNLSHIDSSVLKDSFNVDVSKLKTAQEEVERLEKDVEEAKQAIGKDISAKGFGHIESSLNKLKSEYKNVTKSAQDFVDSLKNGDLEKATKEYEKFNNAAEKIKDPERKAAYEQLAQKMRDFIKSIDTSRLEELNKELVVSREKLDNLDAEEFQKLVNAFYGFSDAAKEGGKELSTFSNDALSTAENMQHVNSELDHFKQRIAYFFGAQNAVNLFKRALQSAFATVKDLDKVMTETAVVTKFDVSQMWEQLPEYTKRANELGVTIHSAYEAATIYYQQGLETNQVMEVSNQTLKMARIAGLDAAEATDRMTNALRGFNMEINELNAERVADVYSKLAAMSASNVDEISTAMTKVASLASNANMEFETTAAFLAQVIETTRESAETAGTALKTVIARFSEVKKLYSTGELLGTDEEGEAIDVNKVSKALRTAGVDLNEYLTGMKGLDDIFIELASKWDNLDQIQQRYIATMAAGSRQQSRFIAMMQDYGRTQQLVSAAENASGASQEQYQKTLESLETKLNRLKNAWDEFIMGIANSTIIKGAVDIITALITAINKLTSVLPGPLNGLAKLGVAFGAFKVGKKLLNNILPTFVRNFKDIGTESGQSFMGALVKSISERKKIFKNNFDLTGIFKGAFKQIDSSSIFQGLDTIEEKRKALMASNYQFQVLGQYDPSMLDTYIRDIEAADAATLKAAETQKKYDQRMAATSAACMVLGSALLMVSGAMEKAGADTQAVETVRALGTALTMVGGLVPVIAALFKALGIGIAEDGQIAQAGWGWIGLILAAIALLITVTITLIKNNETAAQKYERLTEEAKKASEACDDVAEKYEELKNSLAELSEQEIAIEKLIVGTNEWATAVSKVNQKVLELIDNFPELAKYIESDNGILGFSEEGIDAVEEAYRRQVFQAQSVSAYTALDAHRQERESIKENYSSVVAAWDGASAGLISEEYDIAETVSRALNGNADSINELDKRLQLLGTSYDEIIKLNEDEGGAELVNSIFHALGYNRMQLVDEQYQSFLGLGSNTNASEIADSGFYKSLIAPVLLEMAGEYSDEMLKTFSGILDADKINEIIESKAEELDFLSVMSEYKAFFRRLYGNDITFTSTGGIKQNGKEILSAESAKKQYVAGNIDTYGIEEAKATYQNIIDQTKDNLELQKAVLEFYQNDQQSLSKISADRILANLGTIEGLFGPEVANKIGAVAEESEQYFANFADDFNKKVGYDLNTVAESNKLGTGLLTSISTDALESYFNNLSNIYAQYGTESAEKFSDSFYNILEGLDEEEKKKVLELAKNYDFTKYADIKDFTKDLKDLGINVPSEEIKTLTNDFTNLAGITREYNLDSLAQQFANILDLSNDIEDRDELQGLTQEEYDKLIATLPDLEDSFVFDGQNWIYLDGSLVNLASAIKENTAAILGNTAKQLEEKIAIGEETEAIIENVDLAKKYGGVNTQDLLSGTVSNENAVRQFMDAIFGAGYSNKFNDAQLLVDYEKRIGAYANLDQNRADLNAYNNRYAPSVAYQDLINTNAQEMSAGNFTQGMDSEALEQYKELLDKTVASTSNLTKESAQLEKGLRDLGINEEEASIVSKELAIQYNKLETKIDNLRKAIGDELETINDVTSSQEALGESYQKIAKEASKVFGEGIDSSFVEKYLDDFKQLEQGVPEAYDNICRHLTEQNLQTWVDIYNTTHENAIAVAQIIDALDNMDFTVDGFADFSQVEQAAINAGMTLADFINALEQVSGLTVTYDPGALSMIAQAYNLMNSGNPINVGVGAAMLGAAKALMAGSFTVSRGGSNFNRSGAGGYTPKGGSGGGGGGGGKEEKPTYWENPYDELYNLTEKINEALRERERLERRYQKIAQLSVTTAGEMRQAFSDQIAQLEKEINLQKQLEAGRLRQIKNIGNQIYTDKEGNRSTFSQLGVTKYANYNEKTGLIQIDWNAIEAVSRDPNRSEEGEAIEAYISKLEELVEGYEEIRDTIWDMQDEMEDLIQEAIDSYLDFEDRVFNALVEERQKEIDSFEKISDAINDATDRVLDKMEKQIEQERQNRENDKTEEEIADKEARLAYLSRDTSGANAMEIMQLSEELEEARQNYTDSLIDQAIQQMRDDADLAAEQRAEQQAVMEAQLEIEKTNGSIMQQAVDLIHEANTALGSEYLMQVLQNTDGYKNMSEIGKEKWTNDFVEQWNKAQSAYDALQKQKAAQAASAAGTASGTTSTNSNSSASSNNSAPKSKYPLTLTDDIAKGVATSICLTGGSGWGNGQDRINRITEKFGAGAYSKIQGYVDQIAWSGWKNLYSKNGANYTYYAFKKGGLATFTGPAWLDGTRSNPEMVLNAKDTENFIQLKDVLSRLVRGEGSNSLIGDNYYNFEIQANLADDYDVDQMVERLKYLIVQESNYRNVNTINLTR